MGVLIRGMEMPKGCSKCPLRFYEGQGVWVCCITGSLGYDDDEEFKPCKQRGKDCPLIELPPHGRLIDADALLKSIASTRATNRNAFGIYLLYTMIANAIKNAPAIIEAEGADG